MTIKVDGRVVRCDIAAKPLLKARSAIAEHGADGVAVIFQGKLVGDVLVEAGLVVQPKAPKEATGVKFFATLTYPTSQMADLSG